MSCHSRRDYLNSDHACCCGVSCECSSCVITVLLLEISMFTLLFITLIYCPNAMLLLLLRCLYRGMPVCSWCNKSKNEDSDPKNCIALNPTERHSAMLVCGGLREPLFQFIPWNADPQNCVLTGTVLHDPTKVNSETSVTLKTYNFEGLLCRGGLIQASLKCLLNDKLWYCNIIELNYACYKISFFTDIRGRHELSVKVDGKHIRGSPFRIFAQVTAISLGEPVRVICGLKQPLSVTFGENSEKIIVAELEANRVSVMDRNGTRLKCLKHPVLQAPTGVITDDYGSLYVTTKQHILKFSSIGILTKVIAHTVASIDLPLTVKLRSDEKLYVCDPAQNSIIVYNTDLKPTGAITRNNYYWVPYSIAFSDTTAQMFVADPGNHAIQVLDENGLEQNSFSFDYVYLQANSQWRPHTICIIMQTIYVTDSNNHCVFVLCLSGEYVHCYGGEGRKPGMFNHPTGIAVDDDGFVYVCDTGNDRIQVF